MAMNLQQQKCRQKCVKQLVAAGPVFSGDVSSLLLVRWIDSLLGCVFDSPLLREQAANREEFLNMQCICSDIDSQTVRALCRHIAKCTQESCLPQIATVMHHAGCSNMCLSYRLAISQATVLYLLQSK